MERVGDIEIVRRAYAKHVMAAVGVTDVCVRGGLRVGTPRGVCWMRIM
jgi:hypothetical protein